MISFSPRCMSITDLFNGQDLITNRIDQADFIDFLMFVKVDVSEYIIFRDRKPNFGQNQIYLFFLNKKKLF